MTLAQIREKGLEALSTHLGVVGMVRFLQQSEMGWGNYTEERYQWLGDPDLLEARGILPEEAGGSFAPGQNAFCAKICSKIITSQFCIVLINNDLREGQEIPNANVNMEYGLMLGFNKYVIPFQRASQTLPFNVAGLDTVKYSQQDFESQATAAIDQAIEATKQEDVPTGTGDQFLQMFLLSRNMLFTPIDDQGARNIYRLGEPVGFNLLNDFAGGRYAFLGLFASLPPESVLWRLRKLNEILNGRRSSIESRVAQGTLTAEQAPLAHAIFDALQVWVIVTSNQDKQKIMEDSDASRWTTRSRPIPSMTCAPSSRNWRSLAPNKTLQALR